MPDSPTASSGSKPLPRNTPIWTSTAWASTDAQPADRKPLAPSSTYQVVNALIKANKNFEFILIPGAHHTMGENFGEHKRADFFVKNLLGVDPPSWDELESPK